MEEHVIVFKRNCSQVDINEAGARNGLNWPGSPGASGNVPGQQ